MSSKFEKTRFPGVYFKNNSKGDITYYAFYREGEKQLCRRIGKKSEGWTLAKVKDFRIDLMADARKAVSPPDWIIPTPKLIQKAVSIGELVDLYFKRKIAERGEPPKTETESRQRFQKHFSIHWSKTPSEIVELDLLRIRHSILKSGGKMATVSWLLGFY